jgi:hypothetical protein
VEELIASRFVKKALSITPLVAYKLVTVAFVEVLLVEVSPSKLPLVAEKLTV